MTRADTDVVLPFHRIARFIRANLPTAERYDLLAFNDTCVGQYRRLDRSFVLVDTELVSEEKMVGVVEATRDEGSEFAHR